MSDEHPGQIITFFSYKGGTGRTMALANVAWILASHGKRVLTVDWDLDSPGLHRFFQPFLDAELFASTPGVMEMLSEFGRAAADSSLDRADPAWHERFARVVPHAVSLDWPFPGSGILDIISAGRQGRSYAAAVAGFNWDAFYSRLGGGALFTAMREDMRRNYDYTLIDSRTGLSDIAGICTVRFPDTVVNCFTLSGQSIDGAAAVARTIGELEESRDIQILPVPMRVEDGEQAKLEAGRALARSKFAGFPRGLGPEASMRYWGEIEVPYKPFYAYEETLATFGDEAHLRSSLLAAFERLTGAITDGQIRELPPIPEERRKRFASMFERRRPFSPPDVFLSFASEDRSWADWVAHVLRRAGIQVITQGTGFAPGANVQSEVRRAVGTAGCTLVLLSGAYVRSSQSKMVWETLAAAESDRSLEPLIPIRIGEVRLAPPFDSWNAVDLTRMKEEAATEALLRAVGHSVESLGTEAAEPAIQPRYPGVLPPIWSVPQRNASFTGRSAMLDRLRDELAEGMAVVMPQALFGLGGVGKTQLVLEYAHRFKSDYDLVWWVSAEQENLIDAELANIAPKIGIRSAENINEAADAVREALRRGQPYRRWLIVFDNADEPEKLEPHLPTGPGHIIITSRNSGWAHLAASLEVDAFTRDESVEHLVRRVPGLGTTAADQVAEMLGDLPLAIELASGWLEATAMPVEDYLHHLRTRMAEWLSQNKATDYPVTAAVSWQVSIDRLRQDSPAAVRLIELCSCFSPEPIAMRLLYNDETIRCLLPYDELLTEKMVLGRVIREISRYALAKVDQGRNSLQIHRLVQAVVRDGLSVEERESTQHDVHHILVQGRPAQGDTDYPENWPSYNDLWPHLGQSEASECTEEPTRKLLVERVRYLWKRGEFEEGLTYGRRLEKAWSQARGENDRLLLYLRFHIANILRSQGEVAQALEVDQDVLRRQKALFGDTYVHTLMTAGSVAADLRAVGEYQEALRLARDTHEKLADIYGEDDPLTLSAANNLAVGLRMVGDFTTARDLDRRTLESRQQVLTQTHPYTLHSAAQLARDLRETGAFAESTRLLRETLAEYERTLGSDFPETLRTASSLAVSLRKEGQHEEALTVSRDTLERFEVGYRPGYPERVACMLNLACDLSATGDDLEALAVAEKTVTSYIDTLGRDHPSTLVSMNNRAIYLRGVGRIAEALQQGQAALAGFQRKLGSEHPLTLSCAMNVANALVESGRFEEAEALEQGTIHLMNKVLGPEHPDTLFCASNLAATRRKLHRLEEATQLRDATIATMERVLGAQHPHINLVKSWRRTSRDLEPQPA
jgi:tetratricopeptide (TPR) repeat protein